MEELDVLTGAVSQIALPPLPAAVASASPLLARFPESSAPPADMMKLI